MRLSLPIVAVTLAHALAAQTVVPSLRALAPLQTQITVGLQSAQAAQPAGPLPATGAVTATTSTSLVDEASLAWSSATWAYRSEVLLVHTLAAPQASPVSATATLHELVVEFAAVGATVPSQLVVECSSTFSAGVPASWVAIDLGNDGSIDLVQPGTFFAAPQVLGTQPLQVRVLMSSTLPVAGHSSTGVRVTLRPANDVDQWQTALQCWLPTTQSASLPPPYQVFADRGVDALLVPMGALAVYVVGTSQQPTLLPYAGFVPCLLVPSPEFVIFQTGPLHVPLPAAVRPLTFHIQGVALTNAGLQTTEAYSLVAN